MLTILELGPKVIGYHVDGTLDKTDIDRVFQEIDRTLATNDRISVYGEVHSLGGMTMDALWRDLRLSVGHLGALQKIDRVALVTDIDWLRSVAGLENRLFGKLEIRVFSMAQQLEARTWIAG